MIGSDARWADEFGARYTTHPDIAYVQASGQAQRLDFYGAAGTGPHPTMLFFHGGGWMRGDKAASLDAVLPWLARGWNVANANYRLGSAAPAPAAVEDARCALRWLGHNAAELAIDLDRIVLAGQSAGAHLALMAGLLPKEHPLDHFGEYGVAMPPTIEARRSAAGAAAGWLAVPTARAVVNLFGIADLAPLVDGPDARTYARAWLGERALEATLVRDLSPLSHVSAAAPPIVSVHGDRDEIVPYDQASRLHGALDRAGGRHELVTVAGGGHGGFAAEAWQHAYARVFAFLRGTSGGSC